MKSEEEIKKELSHCLQEEIKIAEKQGSITSFRGRVEGWIQALKWVLKK